MTGRLVPCLWLAVLGLVACSSTPPEPAPSLDITELWLLGEVHDNALGHTLRLQTLQALLDRGARPALLMEQFDRERQGQIDRLLQRAPGTAPDDAERGLTVDALVQLGGAAPSGWQWALYRPYLHLALRYQLPLVRPMSHAPTPVR